MRVDDFRFVMPCALLSGASGSAIIRIIAAANASIPYRQDRAILPQD